MVSHADLESDQQLGTFLRRLLAFRNKHVDLLSPPKFDSPRRVQWLGAQRNSSPDWDGLNQDPDGGQVHVPPHLLQRSSCPACRLRLFDVQVSIHAILTCEVSLHPCLLGNGALSVIDT